MSELFLTKPYQNNVPRVKTPKRYVDFKEWKKWLERELLIKKIVTSVTIDIAPVTSQETREYYESHRDEFKRPRMVELMQIVTKTRDEAKQILKKLAAGENMGELAKEYSIAPEAETGGLLDWVRKDDLEERIDKVIFSLPLGKISTITHKNMRRENKNGFGDNRNTGCSRYYRNEPSGKA